MLYKLLTDDDIDLSDYIIDLDKVPFLTRNRDYSLIAEGYNFTISNRSPVIPIRGDKLFFYRETNLVHSGIVDFFQEDEENNAYKIEVKHILSELHDRNVGIGIDEINPFIYKLLSEYAEDDVTIEGEDCRLVQYLSLIEAIFSEIQVDTIGIDCGQVFGTIFYPSEVSVQWYGAYAGSALGGLSLSDEIPIANLYFLPEQIVCMNQNGVYAPANLVGSEFESKMITLFDMLSILCSIVGIAFVPKDKTTFYAVTSASLGSPTGVIDDADIYDIQKEEELVDTTGVESKYNTLSLSLFFASTPAPWSSASVEYSLMQIVTYDGKCWVCFHSHTSDATNYPGSLKAYLNFYWWETYCPTDLPDYYIDADAIYNGTSNSFWQNYISSTGKKPSAIEWYDNFNPILVNVSTGEAWVCSPEVETALNKSCAKYMKLALIHNFIKTTITTKASFIFEAVTFYNFESIYVSDINTDTVEIEYAV